jgi:PD-(D/E)XK nuclease superfamily
MLLEGIEGPSRLDRISPRLVHKASGEPNEKSPSPFLEGTKIQFAWDATCLEALKKCPRYYQYTMIDNWQSRGDAIHLRWGSELGQAIDAWTIAKAEGASHDDAMHESIRALLERIGPWEPDPQTDSESRKSKENLVRSAIWYMDHYEDDAAKVVTLANGKPAVELSFKFELPFDVSVRWDENVRDYVDSKQPYLLCGHLDKVVEFSGDLYVMDHKTTGTTLTPHYFKQYNPHNQMSAYTVASQTIMRSPIKGVIIDGIQVAVGFSRFVRSITYRTHDQLEEWLDNTRRWLRQAEGYAEEGYWPMNDTACSMYGGCRFRDVCAKSPNVREVYLKTKFTQENERWNPLKPR